MLSPFPQQVQFPIVATGQPTKSRVTHPQLSKQTHRIKYRNQKKRRCYGAKLIESKCECFTYTDELTDLNRRLLKAKNPRSITQKSKSIIRESVTVWAVCQNTNRAPCPELLTHKARTRVVVVPEGNFRSNAFEMQNRNQEPAPKFSKSAKQVLGWAMRKMPSKQQARHSQDPFFNEAVPGRMGGSGYTCPRKKCLRQTLPTARSKKADGAR